MILTPSTVKSVLMVESRIQEVRARVVRVTSRVEARVAPLVVLTVAVVLHLEGVQVEGMMEVEIEMMTKINGPGTRLIIFKSVVKVKRSRTQEVRARVATVTSQIEARVALVGLQVVEEVTKITVMAEHLEIIQQNRTRTKARRRLIVASG